MPNLSKDREYGLTRDDVAELLDMDQAGAFRWKKTRRGAKKGEVAGWIDRYGYVVVGIHGRMYKAHRVAWLLYHGDWPPEDMEIDHINGVRADNRKENLRLADRGTNLRNSRALSNNTSGYKGVSWYKKTKTWRSKITTDGICLYLGYYDYLEDAFLSYLIACYEHGFHTNHILQYVHKYITFLYSGQPKTRYPGKQVDDPAPDRSRPARVSFPTPPLTRRPEAPQWT